MRFLCNLSVFFHGVSGTPSGKTPPQSLRDSSPKGVPFGAAVKSLIASETLAMVLTACALSVFASQIHTPLFVAARHLPPERGKSFLKGRGKNTAGNSLIEPNTLAMNFTAWLSLRESWRGSA